MRRKILIPTITSIIIVAVFGMIMARSMPTQGNIYKVKRLIEKQIPPSVSYLAFLLDTRLKETEYIVKQEKFAYLREVASRHATYAGEYAKLAGADVKLLQTHREKLLYLYNNFPAHPYIDLRRDFLNDNINYLDIYIAQLNAPRK